MANRREFLQTTGVALTLPVFARAGLKDPERPDRLIVFDRGFPASRRFGARAEQADRPVRGIDGDITALWVDELSRLWSERPVALAGLTARHTLFCLEQLAWDHRMRVVCHVEHVAQPNGGAAHSVRIPEDGRAIRGLAGAGRRWPEYMADALTGEPLGNLNGRGPSEAAMAASDDDGTILHSWMIAPVLSRARSMTTDRSF